MSRVEIINGDERGHLIIKIDGLLHLKIMNKINVVHSYIDEVTRVTTYKMYYINFHLSSGQFVHCEYNDKELWEEILKGL